MSPLNRQILRLALPSILANITVPLVGMVDIAVSGHLNDGLGTAAFIGGISLGSMLFDLLYWNFYFLRAGTAGMTAQAYGRSDMKECGCLLARGLGVALVMALLIIFIRKPFSSLAFRFIDSSSDVRELALQYFLIRVWAAPATISLMTLRGWFIGMQDSMSSMFTDLVVNCTNIVMSLFLALGFGSWKGMGFPGIALGTVIAQYSGLVFALVIILVKYWRRAISILSLPDVRHLFRGEKFRSFFTLNTDLFLRSLGMTAIYIGFTTISARYGDLMLASGTIIMKLLMLFSFFTDGFAYAAEALVGKFIGMKSREMTKRAVRLSFCWSMAIAAAFIFIYAFAGDSLVRLMTSDPVVAEACGFFLPWLILMPPLGCAAFTWDGVYEGATASGAIRDAMLEAMALFFISWFIGLGILKRCHVENFNVAAIHLLLGVYFIHLLVRTICLSVRYRKDILTVPFQE